MFDHRWPLGVKGQSNPDNLVVEIHLENFEIAEMVSIEVK